VLDSYSRQRLGDDRADAAKADDADAQPRQLALRVASPR
jgi:hypothetical protein